MADATMTIGQVDQVLTEYYRKHPAKAQFGRTASTAKWFRPRGEKMKGSRWHFHAFVEPSTPTRGVAFGTAVAAAFPAAMPLTYKKLSWDDDDLTMFQATGSINIVADIETSDQQMSVYKLATVVVGDLQIDFDKKLNDAVHMGTSAQMGTVNAVYDEDGTTYTSSQTDAFIQITDGAISQFLPGMVLDIDGGTEVVKVKDVITTQDGPWSSAVPVAGIGPGLIIERVSGTANFDGIIAADTIARSGEAAGSNFAGFDTWFDGTANVYNDSDGAAITRYSNGEQWSIPPIFRVATAGSEETFDIDTHLREVADVLPRSMNTGRKLRKYKNPEHSINAPKSLVLITTLELANEATQTVADQNRFTSESAKSMDAAKYKALFGNLGFEGTVWHSATLGPVAIQADSSARKHKMTLIDPQSWFYLYLGKTNNTLGWITNDNGGRWHNVADTSTDRLTFKKQCGAYMACLLACDQPGANAEITGVKSSLY